MGGTKPVEVCLGCVGLAELRDGTCICLIRSVGKPVDLHIVTPEKPACSQRRPLEMQPECEVESDAET